MAVIITDTDIVIEDRKHWSITGGGITVGHDMIEQAVRSAKSVMYQANSERAVQCLLRSSAKDKVCYPAVHFSESNISRVATIAIDHITCSNKVEIEEMDDRQKLLSLLVNRAVAGYGHHIKYGALDESKLHSDSKQLIFITFDSNEVAISERVCHTERKDIMSYETLAKLSDALWQYGWFITRFRVSDSGTEVAYAGASNRKDIAYGEAIEAIKKYTRYK